MPEFDIVLVPESDTVVLMELVRVDDADRSCVQRTVLDGGGARGSAPHLELILELVEVCVDEPEKDFALDAEAVSVAEPERD